jgi:hypothetical protein
LLERRLFGLANAAHPDVCPVRQQFPSIFWHFSTQKRTTVIILKGGSSHGKLISAYYLPQAKMPAWKHGRRIA